MKNAVLAIVTATVVSSVWAGNNCYWTGGGDGVNWSDDANWDVAPQSGVGDILWFTNACSVCNDSADFCPKTLKFRGTGPITVSGQRIAFTSGGTGLDSECYVIMNAPIKVSNNNNSFMHLVRFDYNGLVTVVGAKTLTLTTQTSTPPAPDDKGTAPDVRINGGVSAPDGTLTFNLGKNASGIRPFWVNSILDVKTLNWCGSYRNQYGFVTVGEQKWKNAYVVFGTCIAMCENAYGRTSTLSWSQNARNANGTWDLNGYNQTVDRLWSVVDPNTQDVMTSTEPATLTMKATGDGRCWGVVKGRVSLVWAPETPYAIDFSNTVANATSGDLFVSNGTMSVSGSTTFANVGEIRVGNGATFDLKTTAANALANAKNVLVEGTGVFRVAATATTPFTASPSVRVRLDAGAKLSVPAGVTLKVAALSVGGVAQADTTYSGVSWIDGEGSVEVSSSALAAASWKTPADGAWATASNWQGGAVPGATTAVTIDAAGADYTVTAADGTAHNAAIAVGGGAVNGTATLKVAGAFTQTAGTLNVNPGGRIEIGTGASYTFVSDTSWRDNTTDATANRVFNVAGGEIAIDGGSLTADPFYGRMTVSGTGKTNGKITVKNGSLTVNPWQSGDGGATMQSLRVRANGRIEIGDGGTFYPVSYGWGARPLAMEGGTIAVSGTGIWNARHPSCKNEAQTYYLGHGTVAFSGHSTFSAPGKSIFLTGKTAHANNAYVPFNWTFTDYATVEMVNSSYKGSLYVGGGDWDTIVGSTTVLTLDSEAVHELGQTFGVGSRKGCGILNFKRGTANVGSYRFFVGAFGEKAGNASFAPTGTVNQTGGALVLSGGDVYVKNDYVYGLEIGSTLYPGSVRPPAASGTYNLSGGVFTNKMGQTAVGVGRGTGVFNQTGGTFYQGYNTRGSTSFEGNLAILGLLNGTGTWKMTGGTTELMPSVYIGGCDTNRLHCALALNGHTEDSLAKGLLSVENATFSTARKMVLGERGTGTLEIGSGGSVSVGGDFAVSNAASTVSITLGADGSGSLAIAGDLAVEAGAKLTIDASAVNPDALERGINVMTWGTASRPYADADVTFVGDAQGVLRLKKTAHGYRIPGTRGLILLIR